MRNQQAAQLLALINTRLGAMDTPRTAYERDKAPQTGGDYVAITLSRRFGGNQRYGGSISPSGWRLTTRAVGTDLNNAGVLLDMCTQALEDQIITVDGVRSTPIGFENEDDIRQDDTDDNLWSGLRSWTYCF